MAPPVAASRLRSMMDLPADGGPVDPATAAWVGMVALFTSGDHQQRFHETAGELGLTPASLKALLTMDDPEPRPMRTLAGTWHCDASNVTQLVDALEEVGFVARQPSPTDRRVKLVALTARGQAARVRAIDRLQTPPAALARLSPADLEQLAAILGRLRADLDHEPFAGCEEPRPEGAPPRA